MLPVVLRTPIPEEIPLLLHSWLQSASNYWTRAIESLYSGSEHRGWLDPHPLVAQHKTIMRTYILDLVSDPGVHFIVATLPDVPEEVLGWICFRPEDNSLLYVYTKQPYRQQHVASTLLDNCLPLTPRLARWYTPALRHHVDRWGLVYHHG